MLKIIFSLIMLFDQYHKLKLTELLEATPKILGILNKVPFEFIKTAPMGGFFLIINLLFQYDLDIFLPNMGVSIHMVSTP